MRRIEFFEGMQQNTEAMLFLVYFNSRIHLPRSRKGWHRRSLQQQAEGQSTLLAQQTHMFSRLCSSLTRRLRFPCQDGRAHLLSRHYETVGGRMGSTTIAHANAILLHQRSTEGSDTVSTRANTDLNLTFKLKLNQAEHEKTWVLGRPHANKFSPCSHNWLSSSSSSQNWQWTSWEWSTGWWTS